ncbi:MAG: hypothetical protein QOD36_208 [Mycobacterium sp.]|nr:hypothetical protein [Mycobacterium sp.]
MVRQLKSINVLIWVALLVVVTAVGCGGDAPAATSADGLEVSEGPKLAGDYTGAGPGTLVSAHVLQDIDIDLRDSSSLAARMTYTSTSGIDNRYFTVSGAVFIPRGQAPQGGWPTVAFGHPTTGIQPNCAPSLSYDLLGSSSTITGLLRAGFAVTVPDYQGLGSKDIYHPYLDSTTAGFNLIDSVRAARKLVRDLSVRWVGLGADQGGQAAWAANELIVDFGGGLQQLGSISVAPFTDVEDLADAAAAGTLTKDQELLLIQYLAALEQEYPGFDLDAFRRGIVQQQWDVLLACQRPAVRERQAVVDQITPDDLRPATPDAVETLRGYLRKTSLPQGVAYAPMWVIYGSQDPLAPRPWTERAIERACGFNDTVQIELQADGRPQIDLPRTIEWINARLNGDPHANDCPAFMAGLQGTEPPTEAPAPDEETTQEQTVEEQTTEESTAVATTTSAPTTTAAPTSTAAPTTTVAPTTTEQLPSQHLPAEAGG